MRQFTTGATRDNDETKPDYEGFISPRVVVRFGEYMHKHRRQADGQLRASDNWQKGIPLDAYMKSGWRHFLDWWLTHRGENPAHNEEGYDTQEALCALIFNAQGYLDVLLQQQAAPRQMPPALIGVGAIPKKCWMDCDGVVLATCPEGCGCCEEHCTAHRGWSTNAAN